MPWPLSQDYNEAIQNPVHCFSDAELKQAEAKCNAIGIPMPRSGNFADVYEMTGPGGKKWAVKCFTRQVAGLRERYAAISAYLKQVNLPFMVDFNYLDQGIHVKGQWYPILKMHWVEGSTLNEFVKEYADQPQYLELLAQIWVRLAQRLREARMAHCDLQHGNVLLVPGSTATSLAIRLIDYDGMSVPALAGRKSGEVGHPAFQHPQRLRDGTYNAEVDRFPHLVIYTALRSLTLGSRYLWNKYDNGDNLLFRQQDLERPDDSALFKELSKLKDDQLQKLLVQLRAAVHKPLEQTPLLEELVPSSITARRKSGVVPAAASPVTQTAESIFAEATTGAEPSSARIRPSRPPGKKAVIWACAGGAVAAVALAGGIFLAVGNRGPRDSKNEGGAVAQKDGGESNTIPEPTRKDAPPKTQPRTEPKTEPRTEPRTEPPTEPKTEPTTEPAPAPGGELRRFGKEGTPVQNAVFSADGRSVLCNHGSTMIQCDVAHGVVNRHLNINGGSVPWACLLPDNRTALFFLGNVMSVIDLQNGGLIRDLRGHQARIRRVCVSTDGKRVISGSGEYVFKDGKATGTCVDCTARLWDVASGTELQRFSGHTQPVNEVALSPDGRRVVSASNDRVCLWDADTGKEIRQLTPPLVKTVAFHPDGRQLLIACFDSTVRLWNVETNQEVRNFGRQPSLIHAVAVSADGRYAAGGSGGLVSRDGQSVRDPAVVRLWDIASGKEVHSYEGHTDRIRSLAFSPDGRYVLSAADTAARLWPVNAPIIATKPPEAAPGPPPVAGQEIRRFQADFYSTMSLAYSPDGRRALSAHGNSFCLWDVNNGNVLRRFPPVGGSAMKAAFLPDNRRAVFVYSNRTLAIVDLDTGQLIRQMTVPSYFQSLALSDDGRRLLTGSGASVMKDGQPVRDKDGRFIMEDCTARIWDVVETGKELHRLEDAHKYPILNVALSPDGRRALSSSSDLHCMWDADTGREIRRLNVSPVTRLTMLPDGRHILVSGGNQAVRLWDLEADREVRSFPHPNFTVGLAVSPDGRYFLSGSATFTQKDGQSIWSDCTVRLWEIATGKELRRFEGPRRADYIAFSPDGRYAVSGGIENTIRMWDLGLAGTVAVKPPVPPIQAAVPDAEAQQKARKLVKDLFKQDYARITKSADRAALAAKLIQKGTDTKDDPTARFVLLSEARDLAAQAGDVAAVTKAIDHLVQGYAIDALDMKLKALGTASKAAVSAPANRALVECCLAAADDALAADHYDAALALLNVADPAAKKSKSAALAKRMPRATADVRATQKEFESFQSAAETLRKKPDDAAANLTAGRFLCLRKGEWASGLSHLAVGNDATLQALAKKDLARPATEATQLEVADGWWDLSATSSGTVKAQLQQRAAHWYEQALTGATGITRDRIQARLKEADDNAPKTKLAVQTGEVRRFNGHTARVNSVALSADGKRALSGADDRSIRLWDVATGKQLNWSSNFPAEVRAVAISPDGKYAAISSSNTIRFWDMERFSNMHSHSLSNTPIDCLASLPDNQRFLAGSGSGTPWLMAPLGDPASRARSWPNSSRATIHAVAVSADGRFAILGSADGLVMIYNMDTQREERRLLGHKDDVLGVALSKDARQAVTGGADKTIRVWDTQSGKLLRTITGHEGRVTCIALSADGRRIISGSEDKTIRVWDVKSGRELRRLTGHTDAVTSVAVSAAGRQVLSGSADQSVRLWDLSR